MVLSKPDYINNKIIGANEGRGMGLLNHEADGVGIMSGESPTTTVTETSCSVFRILIQKLHSTSL